MFVSREHAWFVKNLPADLFVEDAKYEDGFDNDIIDDICTVSRERQTQTRTHAHTDRHTDRHTDTDTHTHTHRCIHACL